jgi:hypothetical protein
VQGRELDVVSTHWKSQREYGIDNLVHSSGSYPSVMTAENHRIAKGALKQKNGLVV